MFWKRNCDSSAINLLLEKEDVTLEEILSEPSVTMEVQSLNDELLEFLFKEEILIKMLELLTTTPEPNEDGIIYFTYQNTISEILSSYITNVYEALCSKDVYLQLLFVPFIQKNTISMTTTTTSQSKEEEGGEVDKNADKNSTGDENNNETKNQGTSTYNSIVIINSVTCSLILKVAKMLCHQCSEKMLNFFMNTPTIVDRLIDNIDNCSVTEFLLKSIQSFPQTDDLLNKYLQWLSSEGLITKIVARISTDPDKELVSLKCFQTLSDILSAVRQTKEPNPIRKDIENATIITDIIQLLLNVSQTRANFISTGFAFLKSIFEIPERNVSQSWDLMSFQNQHNRPALSRQEFNKHTQTYRPITDAITLKFHNFKEIIVHGNLDHEIKTVYGGAIKKPLGPHRLAIIELLSHLIELELPNMMQTFVECDFIAIFLEFLSIYPLNSLLYRLIINIINKLILYAFINKDGSSAEQELSNLIITHLFTHHKLINRLMDMWSHKSSNIDGCRINIRSLNQVFASSISNTIINLTSTKNALEKVLPDSELNQWKSFCDKQIVDYNNLNDLDKHVPNTPSDGSGFYEPEDYTKIYEMCLNQKMGESFPDYYYQTFNSYSNTAVMDLNTNPLPDLYIGTPEDKENAEGFEAICNYLLQTKNQLEDDIDDEYVDGGIVAGSNTIKDTQFMKDVNLHLDLNELSVHNDDDDDEGGGGGNDDDDDDFKTPIVNEDGSFEEFASNIASNALSSKFIDDLFKEAYKEKYNSKNSSSDLYPYNKSTSKRPKVPRLNFNSSISSARKPLKPLRMALSPDDDDEHEDDCDEDIDDDEYQERFDVYNNMGSLLTNTKKELGSCQEVEEEDEEKKEEDGNKEPELKSSISRFIGYYNDKDDECEEDDDDNDDGSYLPLSSRLEKEVQQQQPQQPTENLAALDNILDNKTWNSPSNSITNLDSIDISDVNVVLDTVQDVTPTIERTTAAASPSLSPRATSPAVEPTAPSSDKIEETIELNNEPVNNKTISNDVPLNVYKENPFSPKLERFNVNFSNKSFQAAFNRSTSAPNKLTTNSQHNSSIRTSSSSSYIVNIEPSSEHNQNVDNLKLKDPATSNPVPNGDLSTTSSDQSKL